MFGFIKNWIKPKDIKEVKKEYKQIKETWIPAAETIKSLELLLTIADMKVMVTDRAPDEMVECVRKAFKQNMPREEFMELLNLCGSKLNVAQQEDLINRIHQTQEYKEYNVNIRLNDLNKDFD